MQPPVVVQTQHPLGGLKLNQINDLRFIRHLSLNTLLFLPNPDRPNNALRHYFPKIPFEGAPTQTYYFIKQIMPSPRHVECNTH